MRVKICGIRSAPDLAVAVAAGADAVGFLAGLTHRSEDRLDPGVARRLRRRVPPFVQPVLVTHVTEPREIAALAGFVGADTVQLQGDLDPAALAAVRELLPQATLVKAVHVTQGAAAADLAGQVAAVAGVVDAVLLDSRTRDRLGGTGRTHDWSVSAAVVAGSPVPVVLAGGLTPANVADAVATVRPYAVDVNSGVETASGDKSPEACAAFVAAARARSHREEQRHR